MAAASMKSRGPEWLCRGEEENSGVYLEPKVRSTEIGRKPTGGRLSCSSRDFWMLGRGREGSCSQPPQHMPQSCPACGTRAGSPRCLQGSPSHSALPYLRSAEYLWSLPSSEPNQNSRVLLQLRDPEDPLAVNMETQPAHGAGEGSREPMTEHMQRAWHVLDTQQVQLILVC